MLTPPISPADFVSPKAAAPLIIDTSTKGTTSIFISCIKRSPKGLNISASGPIYEPTTAPIIIAIRIQMPKFLSSFLTIVFRYFIQS